MASNTLLDLASSSIADRLAGSWKLAPEQAVTLNPGQAGLLRVTEGRVWATLEGPHHGPANDWGDIVLQRGQQICLLPGQQVVVESFSRASVAANDGAACFSWEPVPAQAAGETATARGAAVRPGPTLAGSLLRAALRALGRLDWLVAGRGQVLRPLESNQP